MIEQNNETSLNVDFQLNPIKIGSYEFLVNRDVNENLHLLHNFEHVIPKYDEENGPHIDISIDNKVPNRVPLKKSVINSILIKGASDMTDNEYYSTFVSKKRDYLEKYLIGSTYAKGYHEPSSIQNLAIIELLQGKDCLGQAKSGTGKTHTFLYGLLYNFDPDDAELQYIFISSSHEVATQIYVNAKHLLTNAKNGKTCANISLCIGQKKDNGESGGFKAAIGTSNLNNREKTPSEERKEVENAQILVCTMGKFYHYLFNSKWIPSTKFLKAICVDEFDTIIASRSKPRSSTIMSTEQQMAAIMQQIPKNAQRVFLSATVTSESLEIAHSYFRPYDPTIGDPFMILLKTDDYTLEGIRQYYIKCRDFTEKKDTLMDILKLCHITQAIIFTNKIEVANEIKDYLDDQSIKIPSAVFHGQLSAITRKNIYQDFVANKIRLLISTDLSARGLDVQGINVVINFDMPGSLQNYIHRVGRSGRYGRKGVAISLVLANSNINEMKKISEINECSTSSTMKPVTGDDLPHLL